MTDTSQFHPRTAKVAGRLRYHPDTGICFLNDGRLQVIKSDASRLVESASIGVLVGCGGRGSGRLGQWLAGALPIDSGFAAWLTLESGLAIDAAETSA